jgi:3-isopropylmalate/(R)-2-methylmalate dehydratase small subunit
MQDLRGEAPVEKLIRVTGPACPLDIANLNTDALLPARFLKVPRAAGLGQFLLHDLQRDAHGHQQPDFPLNRPLWRDARIIVGARNFGCGSSRESAVYALMDAGIRCVIAPSFGDIFFANAVQNGLLAATVAEEDASTLMQILNDGSALPLSVDLEERTITCGNRVFAFTIDDVSRARLLNGWDDIGLTKNCREAIAAFKADDRRRRPWASPAQPTASAQRYP